MPDILHSVPIKASPTAVYKAITEPEGLRSWWTTDVEAEAKQGSLAVFRFEGGQVQMRMRVKSLSPGKGVRWQVEEPTPPEWEGTEISWDLSENDGGTSLLFAHRGWKSMENSFLFINYSWGYYLLSLVKYLEEGKRLPPRQAQIAEAPKVAERPAGSKSPQSPQQRLTLSSCAAPDCSSSVG